MLMKNTMIMDDDEKQKKLEETNKIIKSLVIPYPHGVHLKRLCKDYFEMEGKSLDSTYKECGLNSLSGFLQSLTGKVMVDVRGQYDVMFYPVMDEETAHIQTMVAEQQNRKGRKRTTPTFSSTPVKQLCVRRSSMPSLAPHNHHESHDHQEYNHIMNASSVSSPPQTQLDSRYKENARMSSNPIPSVARNVMANGFSSGMSMISQSVPSNPNHPFMSQMGSHLGSQLSQYHLQYGPVPFGYTHMCGPSVPRLRILPQYKVELHRTYN